MSNKDELKAFYPSQLGYRSLNERTNIARKMLDAFYPDDVSKPMGEQI